MDNRDDTLTINFSPPKPGQKPSLLRRTMTRVFEEILGMCGRQQVANRFRHGPGVLGTVTTRGVADLEVVGANTIVVKTQCSSLSRITPGLVDRHDRATLVQNSDAPRQQLEGNGCGGRDAQAAVRDVVGSRHVVTVERRRRTGQARYRRLSKAALSGRTLRCHRDRSTLRGSWPDTADGIPRRSRTLPPV